MDNFVNFFQIYLLIMVRFIAILMVAPLFSSNVIPNSIKMALAFIATATIFPLVADISVQAAPTFVEYFLTLVNEALIGILIGFLMSIIFAAYQVMANFFDIQMGFGISETVDPISQVAVPVLGQLQSLIAVLIFIAIDGPSWVVRTLFYSFKAMPVLSEASKAVFASSFNGVIDRMMYYMSSLFSIALSLACSFTCFAYNTYFIFIITKFRFVGKSSSADEYFNVRFSYADRCGYCFLLYTNTSSCF